MSQPETNPKWTKARALGLAALFLFAVAMPSGNGNGLVGFTIWTFVGFATLAFLVGVVGAFFAVMVAVGYAKQFGLPLLEPRRDRVPFFGENKGLVTWQFISDFLIAQGLGGSLKLLVGKGNIQSLIGLALGLGAMLGLRMGISNYKATISPR